MSSIRVSANNGVNPALDCCFLCMKPRGVALLGEMTRHRARSIFGKEIASELHGPDEDVEAPRMVVTDKLPCDECKKFMEQGIILISVDESRTEDPQNPYRTGGWVVVTEDAIKRLPVPEEVKKNILDKRVSFMSDEAWNLLGLPNEQTSPTRS